MEAGAVVVLVTAPSVEKAAEMGRAVVEARLAACVSVLPQARSIYRWEGAIADETEAVMVIKTRAEVFEALRAQIVAAHPYKCPEILALPVVAGHAGYLDWLTASVGPAMASPISS